MRFESLTVSGEPLPSRMPSRFLSPLCQGDRILYFTEIYSIPDDFKM